MHLNSDYQQIFGWRDLWCGGKNFKIPTHQEIEQILKDYFDVYNEHNVQVGIDILFILDGYTKFPCRGRLYVDKNPIENEFAWFILDDKDYRYNHERFTHYMIIPPVDV